MKLTIVNNSVVATSENEADAIALIKLGSHEAPPATVKASVKGRGGKMRKYFTAEEKKAAMRRHSRKYYRKMKAARAAAKQEVVNNAHNVDTGTPVTINRITEEAAPASTQG